MTRRSFTVLAGEVEAKTVVLRGKRAAHFRKAFGGHANGPADGKAIELLTDDGKIISVLPEKMTPELVELRVVSQGKSPVPPAELILAAAIIKPRKMDFLVEKAAELGVTKLIPLITARTMGGGGASANRLQRWRGKALSAGSMNDRPYPTVVEPPRQLKTLVAAGTQTMLVLHATGDKGLGQALKKKPLGDLVLVVGPEGDLTGEELTVMRENGAELVSLGEQVLRAETAALAGLAIVNSIWHWA